MRARARLARLVAALACGVTAAVGVPRPGGAVATGPAPALARLTALRAAAHPGFDRLVFQFAGPLPARRSLAWVPRVVEDPSGRPVTLRGRAFLRVVFAAATAHTASGAPSYPGALPSRFDLPVLVQVVRAGDFENVLTFGVGLWQRSALHVFTLTRPSRVVVDVRVPPTPPSRLTAVDHGRLVFLRVGQRTTVALRTCVSCGDVWRIARAPARGVVRVAASSVVPLPHAPGVVGFPYERRWSLRATGTGQTRLELVEYPPRPGAPPLRRFALRLRVRR